MTTHGRPTEKVRECAARHGVTIRTVRTWITKGAVEVVRTPGRQVRVVVEPPRQNSEER